MQVGIAFKEKYFESLVKGSDPSIDFVEFIFENLAFNEVALQQALEVASRLPCTLHCTSFNIGGETDLNQTMLNELNRIQSLLAPVEVSDHLCFTAHGKTQHHDLLPIAFTKENLERIATRVSQIQETISRPLALENLSAYVLFKEHDFTEYDFLLELSRKTGSKILLDLNNLVVNQENHGEKVPLETVDLSPVAYCHVAGYEVFEGAAIDTHGAYPSERVFENVDKVLNRGIEKFLIEWDQNIPPFSTIQDISQRLKSLANKGGIA